MFDFTGRCAFAICTQGEFKIKLLNSHYTVTRGCLLACMPFVNIYVTSIMKQSEIIFGGIQLKDIPNLINKWVNAKNLSAIHSHPIIKLKDEDLPDVLSDIQGYKRSMEEMIQTPQQGICSKIQQDLVDLKGRLVVGTVLKKYFETMPMETGGETHREIIFQRFMLALYFNVREHRDVRYYAGLSGISEKYFSTLIRELSGTSPSKWIETVVMGEAKTLLQDEHMSIKEIASCLNFPDAPTFTKYFRRLAGVTPKAYRNKH